MALMASADFRSTDITTYIPISILAAGASLPISTAGAVRCWQAPANCKILAMRVITGSVAVTGVTYTAAYDTQAFSASVLPTTTLLNVLATTAVTAVASTSNSCPIDVVTPTSPMTGDNLPPTIPAGSVVGFNHTSVATAASSICGVQITYRFV